MPGVTFGELLRKAREARGLSQADLAANVGLSQQAIWMLEAKHRRPRLDTVHWLITALECSDQQIVEMVRCGRF